MQLEPFQTEIIESNVELSPNGAVFAFWNHNVPMQIVSSDLKLIESIKQFYPSEWHVENFANNPNVITVIWETPEKVLKKHTWQEISDPDCKFKDGADSTWIIQRDFISKKINGVNYLLFTKNQIDDGYFNFLRAVLPVHLLKNSQVLFHSSCVVDQNTNEAIVFFGYSGAGKTTISQLCQKGLVIGDDMNLITIGEKSLIVEPAVVGQRFYDKNTFGNRFKVKKMYWLTKDTQISSAPLSSKSTKLLSSFSGLFWDRLPKAETDKVFQLVQQIITVTNIQELKFNLSNEVWDYVRSN